MKNIFIIGMMVLALISCSEQKDQALINAENGATVSKKANLIVDGQIPSDNPLYLAFINEKKYSLNEADKIYRAEIEKSKKFRYHKNLQHIGFKFVMDSGLAETGTKDQKLFYLNEQVKMKRNFPNFENFYTLLISCKPFMNKDQILKIEAEFYLKNIKALKNAEFGDKSDKQQKITNLLRQKQLFERFIETNIE